MKQCLTLTALFVLLISASILTSCEKSEISDKPALSCTTEFTGESTSCSSSRQAIYKFISENDETYIKIQGDLINFTGANAVVSVTGASLAVTQLPSSTGPDRIITLEGAVSACQEVIITIIWNAAYPGGAITGDWFVKNASGTELALPVPGLKCADE